MATNRAPQVDAVAAVFLTLTWVTGLLRIYVRGFMSKTFGLEDWLATISLLLFTSTAIFAFLGIAHSMGMHLAEIPLQNLTPAMKYWFATELAYVVTTCVLKMSIAVFLLRIAIRKWQRIILYFTMCLVMVLTIGYFLFLVFQCKPVDYFWNQFSGKPGSCLPPTTVGALTYTHSGVNAFADIILAFLPVIIVSQLQMNIRTKITVSTILSLGIVACAAAVVRIPYVKVLVDNASDFLFSSTDVVIWSAIEPGLAITASNVATLRPLFSAFLSRTKLFGSSTAHSKASTYGRSKTQSGHPSRRGYVRSGSRGNMEEMGLSPLDKGANTVVVEARDDGYESERRNLASSHSQRRLQHGTGWDVERQNELGENVEPIGEWPMRPKEIRKTVRTEVWSESPQMGPMESSRSLHERRQEQYARGDRRMGGARSLHGVERGW